MTRDSLDGVLNGVDLTPQELALFDIRTVFDPESSAIQTLRSVLDTDSDGSGVAWIALPSAQSDLVIEHVHGAATGLLSRLLVQTGRGLTGKVFNHGKLEWVDHYTSSTTITHEFDHVIQAEGVVRMLAAPLRVDEEINGVLTLASRREGVFGSQAVERIELLARKVGLALQIARHSRLHAEAAVTAERTRISEELHDGVGALLFSISSRTDRIRRRFSDDNELTSDLDALQRELELAGRGMREMLATWRRAGESDLQAEIVADAQAFELRTGVRCTVVFLGGEVRLDHSRTEALKRFTREALLNVEKHAKASSVSIAVAGLINQTSIAVTDDGGGLRVNPERGFGLHAARERIHRLGGGVSVVQDSDKNGVIARAWIPR